MADFIPTTGKHGLDYINFDLVRYISTDMDGKVTLIFDATHRIMLEGQDARDFQNELDRRWRAKLQAA